MSAAISSGSPRRTQTMPQQDENAIPEDTFGAPLSLKRNVSALTTSKLVNQSTSNKV